MADWPPKKNATFTVTFGIRDADGDLVTGAATLDSEVSKDGGTFTDCTNEAAELATSSGVYSLALTATEMNADIVAVITKTGTAGAKTALNVMYTVTRQIVDLAYPTTSGRSMDVDATGGVEITANQAVNVAQWSGSNVAAPSVAGVPEVDLTHINGAAQTATLDDIEAQTDDIGAAGAGLTAIPWNAAWDAEVQSEVDDALVARFLDKLVLASGTADSGSTTTVVDAERTEADTDYWKGAYILITSGTAAGQVRLITAFTPATDTITFAPALTQAVTTNTYVLLPSARADVHFWLGSVVNALQSGRVDSYLGATATGVIAAASFAAGAIDAAAIASSAIDADAIATGAITAAKFAAGAIDAAAIATGAIDADAIAADAIGASELAADAANEIADALLKRDVDQVEATAAIHSLTTAILKAVARIRDNAGTLEIYRTDGTTIHASQTVTTDAALNPIDELSGAA